MRNLYEIIMGKRDKTDRGGIQKHDSFVTTDSLEREALLLFAVLKFNKISFYPNANKEYNK
jgi:hypothetical protein